MGEERRDKGSNVYPQSMFGAKIRKISFFSTENFHFYNFKNLCILHGYVFIMSKMEDFQ